MTAGLIGAADATCTTVIHRNTGGGQTLFHGDHRRTCDDFRPSEAAIDQIVANCNGDVRGALKALLLVNEHLEAELQQLYAAAQADFRRQHVPD